MSQIEYLDHIINLIEKSKNKSIDIKTEDYIKCINKEKKSKDEIEKYMSKKANKKIEIIEHIFYTTIKYI